MFNGAQEIIDDGFLKNYDLNKLINDLIKQYPNDQELGKEIRKLFNNKE